MLPPGVKDVCEFFKVYDLAAFRELLKSANEPKFHYKAYDLEKPLEDVDWLVDGMFARGDAALIYGPGGVGKSWYTMSLAVAVVEGHDSWLGMEIPEAVRGQRVMYVDQENPEDVFHRRWFQLGYTPGNKLLRPLWYPGVRLDDQPEYLYEDVEAFEPVLLVVDSMSRIHTKNENSAEEMNPLMNDGILPIARNLKCSVLTIHHTPHDSQRARGSTTLGNAHDMTVSIDWRKDKKGERLDSIIIRPDKLRRTGVREFLDTKIVDQDDGEPAKRVAIEVLNGEGMPF
jgi:KaiC/GvpD/RAD55 family RecA-like ATPase